MSHMCKRIFKFELQLSSYWQNIKFSQCCPKFHIFTNIVIFQVYLQLFRPTIYFIPINFMAGTCQESGIWSGKLFFTLASCKQLTSDKLMQQKATSDCSRQNNTHGGKGREPCWSSPPPWGRKGTAYVHTLFNGISPGNWWVENG